MQVFLCWSGAASHQIAQALHGFLGDVIQDLKPFLSSESIRKGQRWEAEIGKRLADTNYGIVCLTKDNLTAPWILFEAGALSKNIAESRVTALLAGIQPTDVLDPLSQFQQTRADRADLFKLLKDLNELLPPERRLEADRLTRAFDSFWTPFEKKFNDAIASVGAKGGVAPARNTPNGRPSESPRGPATGAPRPLTPDATRGAVALTWFVRLHRTPHHRTDS